MKKKAELKAKKARVNAEKKQTLLGMLDSVCTIATKTLVPIAYALDRLIAQNFASVASTSHAA